MYIVHVLLLFYFLWLTSPASGTSLVLEQGCRNEKIRYSCITVHAFQHWVIHKYEETMPRTKIYFSDSHEKGHIISTSAPYFFQLIETKNSHFISTLSFQYTPEQEGIIISCTDGHNGDKDEQIFHQRNIPDPLENLVVEYSNNTEANLSWSLSPQLLEMTSFEIFIDGKLYQDGIKNTTNTIVSGLNYSNCLTTCPNSTQEHGCTEQEFQVRYYSGYARCYSRPANVTARPPGDDVKVYSNDTEDTIVVYTLQSHCSNSNIKTTIEATCITDDRNMSHGSQTVQLAPGAEHSISYNRQHANHTDTVIIVTDENGEQLFKKMYMNTDLIHSEDTQYNSSTTSTISNSLVILLLLGFQLSKY